MGVYRLLLACLVVAVHAHKYPLEVLPDAGLAAVGAFFFISGYLMPSTFVLNYKDADTRRSIRKYMLSRFTRIFPFYWLSLLLMLVPLLLLGRSFAQFVTENPGYLVKQFLLFGLNLAELWGSDARLNGPAWTLDIELQYYVLAPFLVLWWKSRPAVVVVVVALVMLAGAIVQIVGTGLVSIDRSLLAWSPLFGAGFLAALYPEHARALLSTYAPYAAGAVACLAAAVLLPSPKALTFALTLVLTMVAAHLVIGSSPRPANSFDKVCGDLSYPVYVFHTILPSLVPIVRPDSPATFANWLVSYLAILAAAFAISFAAQYGLGRSIDRWRTSLHARRSA